MAKSITLFIPGLLEHLPDPIPRLPALETLLARADCRNDLPVGYERTLMYLFGLPQAPDRDVPEGALGRYAQTGEKPEGVWMCAAPVHLFADQSRVYLNSIDETALSENDAAQLVAELNRLYREDGWEFVQHTTTRWYLRISTEPNIRTTPLRDVDGKPIHDKLPQGDDALQWHRVLNEMQMLLHTSPLNQARQKDGKVAVNGVWLWGMGGYPEAETENNWNAVYSDLPLVQGLAKYVGTQACMMPDSAADHSDYLPDGSRLIVYMPKATNVDRVLRQLEQKWFKPLLGDLRKRRVDRLTLLFADGTVRHISAIRTYYFWKLRKTVGYYAQNLE